MLKFIDYTYLDENIQDDNTCSRAISRTHLAPRSAFVAIAALLTMT